VSFAEREGYSGGKERARAAGKRSNRVATFAATSQWFKIIESGKKWRKNPCEGKMQMESSGGGSALCAKNRSPRKSRTIRPTTVTLQTPAFLFRHCEKFSQLSYFSISSKLKKIYIYIFKTNYDGN